MKLKTVKGGRLILKRDWRKSEDYKSLEEYSLDKWAWEFLRRNPEYCREYRESTEGMTEVEATCAYFPGCQKWDLNSWLDPDREYFNIGFIPPGGTEAGITSADFPKRKGTIFLIHGEETGEVFFRFDTRKPINPQVENAKRQLLKLQEKQRGERRSIFKPRQAEWITLLRVLDATAEGNRPKAIAEVFYPNEEITSTGGRYGYRIKEISDKIKQATRYTSHDYRLIPFLTK